MEHLLEVAIKTEVNFEWLATGRGACQANGTVTSETALLSDIANNDIESRMLGLMRLLSSRKQEMACEMIELLATR